MMDKWLRNNTVVWISALVIGTLLWAVVHLDEQQTIPNLTPANETKTIKEVQITVVGLDEAQYDIQSIEPKLVDIVLKGSSFAINQVSTANGQSEIQVDLSKIAEGENTLPLKSVGFPAGVSVDITPNTVVVIAEAVQKKEVPVQIQLSGQPAEGFITGTPILNPNRAHVSVPSNILEKIMAVRAVVDVNGATSAVIKSVKLEAIDNDGQVIDAVISPAVVDVEVPVTSPFKTIPLKINLLNQPPAGYSISSISQSVKEVTIYASDEDLKGIDIYDVIDVDLSKITRSQTINLSIPLVNKIQRVHPETVQLSIKIVPSVEQIIEQLTIEFSGENQQYLSEIIIPESQRIDLPILGAPDVLAKIEPGDIQALVDVSNLPPGTYDLPVKLNLPTYVKYGGEPIIVQVEIKPKEEPTVEPTG